MKKYRDAVGSVMNNRDFVEGDTGRPPGIDNVVQYLDPESKRKKVMVMSRCSKGLVFVNVKDGSGSGIDRATGLWRFNVLAMEGIYGSCVVFMPRGRWGEESCVQAKKKEIAMWEKFGKIELVEDVGQQNIDKMVAYGKGDGTGTDKGQGRIGRKWVVSGFYRECGS